MQRCHGRPGRRRGGGDPVGTRFGRYATFRSTLTQPVTEETEKYIEEMVLKSAFPQAVVAFPRFPKAVGGFSS